MILQPDATLWPQASVYPSMTWPVVGIPPANANRANAVVLGGAFDQANTPTIGRGKRVVRVVSR